MRLIPGLTLTALVLFVSHGSPLLAQEPRICGEASGVLCDDGEFCKFRPGDCGGAEPGICVPIPNACPLYYDPVCGCDGNTYGNACEADAAGVTVDYRGACVTVCGGIAGLTCPEGQFCALADGECCCDFQGVCRDIPGACPDVWAPVCGCDGKTYGNRCEAAAAGVSVDRLGPCESEPLEIQGVVFDRRAFMRWKPADGALAYNVYVKRLEHRPPEDYGRCAYSGVRATSVTFPGEPQMDQLWLIQVTGLFPVEGPMGTTSSGDPRKPAAPCRCTLPSDTGPCAAVIERWYHDFERGECVPFIWGGCGGNANNFESEPGCEDACEDACGLPPEPGDCEALIRRWFHDPLTGECHVFIWGGCGGNANNFATLAECQQGCHDVCRLEPDPGPCDGAIPRWYHDAATGKCDLFIYGGCLGNGNNFPTQTECERHCTDFCALPPDPGPCDALIPRWYHDAATGECREFVWGGCDGNANNFETEEACKSHCGHPSASP